MKDKKLYEHCKYLVQAIIKCLEDRPVTIPGENYTHIEPINQGGWSISRAYRTSFWGLLGLLKKQIKVLPEYVNCLSYIETNNEISNPVKDEFRELLNGFIVRILSEKRVVARDLLEYYKKLDENRANLSKLDEDSFSKHYARFEEVLYSGNMWLAFAPLVGFKSNCDLVELGEVSIKKIPREQLAELWYHHGHDLSMIIHEHDFINTRYCLWAPQRTAAEPKKSFDSVIRSLRLWKEGRVGYSSMHIIPMFNFSGGSHHLNLPVYDRKIFSLGSDEAEDFQRFFEMFSETKTRTNELDIAISRFGYSYERMRMEDKLIDLMIAFESIFCEDPNAITHKLSTRVARFLEQEQQLRVKLRKNMKQLYSLRSGVVHGNKRLSTQSFWLKDTDTDENLRPHEYVSLLEGYLRQSLHSIINRTTLDVPFSKTTFLEEIDWV